MSVGAVGELPGDEDAALAADAHSVEAGVHSGNDLTLALRAWPLQEGQGGVVGMVEGGVELGAIDEVAGVVDGVPLARGDAGPAADFGVDVA